VRFLGCCRRGDNAGADDVAQDEGHEERERSVYPFLEEGVWAPGDKIDDVDNEKDKRAKYPEYLVVRHADAIVENPALWLLKS
jgi:hypothetical protein